MGVACACERLGSGRRGCAQRRADCKVSVAPGAGFSAVTDRSEAAWQQTVNTLFSTHRAFWQAIEAFEDNRLEEKVPGRSYSFYVLFMGWADHMIYHAGQIALLKKAQS